MIYVSADPSDAPLRMFHLGAFPGVEVGRSPRAIPVITMAEQKALEVLIDQMRYCHVSLVDELGRKVCEIGAADIVAAAVYVFLHYGPSVCYESGAPLGLKRICSAELLDQPGWTLGVTCADVSHVLKYHPGQLNEQFHPTIRAVGREVVANQGFRALAARDYLAPHGDGYVVTDAFVEALDACAETWCSPQRLIPTRRRRLLGR